MPDRDDPGFLDYYGSAGIESTGGRLLRLRTRDGTGLRAAAWRPAGPADVRARGTVLYLNGRTEFIEKNLETVEELLKRGFRVFTLDWRGQGLSDRRLANRHKGHVEDFDFFLSDLALFLESHVLPGKQGPLFLLGHSMGGHIGLRFLHDRPGVFSAAVFCAPMVDIASPAWQSPLVAGIGWLGGSSLTRSWYLPMSVGDYQRTKEPYDDNRLTTDPVRFEVMHEQLEANPKLALGSATWGWLAAAKKSIATLHAPGYAEAIKTPVLIVGAGQEKIVDNAAQEALAARLPSGRREVIEEARHEILLESEPLRLRFWKLFDAHLAPFLEASPGGGAS